MAKKDSTTENPEEWEWLGNLLPRALWPLDGFIRTLDGDHETYQDLLAVLIPLVDRIRSDFDVINEVLSQSFGGPIRVETCDLETFKPFDRDNLKRAFIAPQAAAEGGES